MAWGRRAQANHTATHLLQAALKQIVDPAIGQAGSLVDFDRLRFDFHCPRAVTPAELEQIEALINGWISEAHTLQVAEMAIEQAMAAGAVAMFGEKYADVVRVVDVPGVSMELCGGTHVANTAEIGLFKIVSESGVAAGIRRIEAVAGPAVLAYLKEREAVVKQLGERFKAQPAEIVERVAALAAELKATQKALAAARSGRSGQGDPGGGLRGGGDRGRPQGRGLHRRRGKSLRRRRWRPAQPGPGERARRGGPGLRPAASAKLTPWWLCSGSPHS
jgi:alanyl-tRNA synthetase